MTHQYTELKLEELEKRIEVLEQLLPSAEKTGHWIEVENYSDVKHKIKCSNCEEYIFSKGHARSQYTREHYPFCSMCGARMFESQESEVSDADSD